VSASEPLISFLPEAKSLVQRYGSWLYLHLLTFMGIPIEFIKRVYLGTRHLTSAAKPEPQEDESFSLPEPIQNVYKGTFSRIKFFKIIALKHKFDLNSDTPTSLFYF
jgi:hypothetical protein